MSVPDSRFFSLDYFFREGGYRRCLGKTSKEGVLFVLEILLWQELTTPQVSMNICASG